VGSRGEDFGFGSGAEPYLPQPGWFKRYTIDAEHTDPESTLNTYRQALQLRKPLQTTEELEFETAEEGAVHSRRPNGWQSLLNVNKTPVSLPSGKVIFHSGIGELGDTLPGETTVWIQAE
jgi:alpha-glucosidase